MKDKYNKEVKIEDNKGLTVGKLKKLLEGYDDDKNIVILSTSGLEWKMNERVLENPSDKNEEKQVVIYIT